MDGYSARVLREWYTHIGGAPTRLQASTRYIDYEHGFEYFTPPRIEHNGDAKLVYQQIMNSIADGIRELDELGIPREDSANALPLGMLSRVSCKFNLRTLIDMSHQRLCTRAYHEYRKGIMKDLMDALADYSEEWKYLTHTYFEPKCRYLGWCPEGRSGCGYMPSREEVLL